MGTGSDASSGCSASQSKAFCKNCRRTPRGVGGTRLLKCLSSQAAAVELPSDGCRMYLTWNLARYRLGAVCEELGNQGDERVTLYSLVNANGKRNMRHRVIHSSAPQCWLVPASVARFSNCCAVRCAHNAQYVLCISMHYDVCVVTYACCDLQFLETWQHPRLQHLQPALLSLSLHDKQQHLS